MNRQYVYKTIDNSTTTHCSTIQGGAINCGFEGKDEQNPIGDGPSNGVNVGWTIPLLPGRSLAIKSSIRPLHRTEPYEDQRRPQRKQEPHFQDEKAPIWHRGPDAMVKGQKEAILSEWVADLAAGDRRFPPANELTQICTKSFWDSMWSPWSIGGILMENMPSSRFNAGPTPPEPTSGSWQNSRLWRIGYHVCWIWSCWLLYLYHFAGLSLDNTPH